MSSSFQVLFRVQTPKHHWLYCNKPTLTDTVSLEVWRRLSATTELTSDYHIEESGLLTSVVQHPHNLQQIRVVGHIRIIDLFDKRANIWQW